MPSQLTYPGVYIEEIPSGVRTIMGVATSITAFIGRAARGPVNIATTITSFSDYERTFGGLSANSTMSFAVRDFFQNGGSQAVIVRLMADNNPKPSEKEISGLTFQASSPGEWGDRLKISFDTTGVQDPSKFFNIAVGQAGDDGEDILLERIKSVTFEAGKPRSVDAVLERESQYLRAKGTTTSAPSQNTQLADGTPDGVLADGDYIDSRDEKKGIYSLENTDLFNMLCIPPDQKTSDTSATVLAGALTYCRERRAMLIVDSPVGWQADGKISANFKSNPASGLSSLGLSGQSTRNAALYFPRVKYSNPINNSQQEEFPACGVIAGLYAFTDTTRGVWKAPAGLDAGLVGVQSLAVKMNDAENGLLNPLGINCLREFPVSGRVIWGARTLRGADGLADEYKYVPVRRTALFIEESLYRGTQWAVFEPNDEPLWAQLRLNIGSFMHDLFRQGAFQGSSPREAYLVKCDKETTTQSDINKGIVNVVVGFAPLKPAEFVVIKLQQLAGQIDT